MTVLYNRVILKSFYTFIDSYNNFYIMYSYNNYSKEAHMKQYNWATLGCGVNENELYNAITKKGKTH